MNANNDDKIIAKDYSKMTLEELTKLSTEEFNQAIKQAKLAKRKPSAEQIILRDAKRGVFLILKSAKQLIGKPEYETIKTTVQELANKFDTRVVEWKHSGKGPEKKQ